MHNKFSSAASKLHHLAWCTVLALSLAACGADDPSSTAAQTGATTSAAAQPFTLNGVPETSVTAGATYRYTPSSSGANGRVLAYDIVNKPEWATFDETSGELSGTPDASNVGTTGGVEIGVSNGTTSATVGPFNIRVIPDEASTGAVATHDPVEPILPIAPNTPPTPSVPTIAGTPSSTVLAGQPYGFTPVVSAPSGAVLSFSIVNRPAWATFSTATGALSGKPTSASVGNFTNIVISVSTDGDPVSLPAFSIQVQAASDSVPTISGTPATTVAAGGNYAFTPVASDPDGNVLTFSILNAPSWTSFNTSTGELSGSPPASAAANVFSNIVISVSDGTATASHAAFSITVTQATGVSPKSHAYPRLGSYFIGGSGPLYQSDFVNFSANYNVVIVDAWAGAGVSMYGGSRHAMVAALQALSSSSVNSQVFQYYNTDAGNPATAPPSFGGLQTGLWNLVAANPSWWAWANASSQSQHIFNSYSSSWYQSNQTLAAGQNGDGLYFEAAAAQNQYQFYWTSTGGADEADNMAGLFRDNFFPSPNVAYDYNSSGSPTATSDPTFGQSFRDGLAQAPAWIHANTSLLMLGNVAEWGTSSPSIPLTGYAGILNGGVFESAFGESYSEITWGGYANFQSQYSTIMSNMAAPAYVILGHDNLTSTGTDPYQSKPYAALRFGLTATLVNGNGYYFGNNGYNFEGGSEWFDEYAANSSGVCPTYNGTAASVSAGRGYMGYPTSTWGSISGSGNAVQINGLWARMFYNPATGLTWVAINSPPGSGSITINASSFGRANFKMLTGTQDPATNNGATVPSVTIPSGYDGRIAQLL